MAAGIWACGSYLHSLLYSLCPGFSCRRVNFLPGSHYSAVFWIWAENNVSNMLMFQLCRAAHAAQLARGWGHAKLGGDAARTADPAGQKDIP